MVETGARRAVVRRLVRTSPSATSLQNLLEVSISRARIDLKVSALKDQAPDLGLAAKANDGKDKPSHNVASVASFVGRSGQRIDVYPAVGGSGAPVPHATGEDVPRDSRKPFKEEVVKVPVSEWEEKFGWRVEQTFWNFFNKSEDPEGWNRRWIVERDVPWEAIAREPLSDDSALMIESFFAVESFLPDFAEKGLGYYRTMVGMSNSHINWSYEELKHGRTLQLILERSGARTPDQTREFRLGLARSEWTMPYPTARQMLIYAAFQEKETQRNYELLRGVLNADGSLGAGKGLRIIGRDEAFHHAFYKDLVRMLLAHDEVGTAQDIQKVATSFRMPAQHLMPDMEQRVRVMVRNRVFGKKQVINEAIIPTIKAFGFRDQDELISVANARPSANDTEVITIDPEHDAPDLEE